MKYKTTKKDVMERMWTFYCGYCEYQDILDYLEENAYTCGVYGWNADIYEMRDNMAIVTGYRPFGEYRFTLTDDEKEELKEIIRKGQRSGEYGRMQCEIKRKLRSICWSIKEKEDAKNEKRN